MEKPSFHQATANGAAPADEGVATPNRFFRGAAGDRSYWLLLVANYVALFVGSVASSLLSRFYFIHGGSSRWVSTWVQSTGFPLLLIPIYLSSCRSRRRPQTAAGSTGGSSDGDTDYRSGGSGDGRRFSSFTPRMLCLCAIVGVFMGINNFLFSWGISYLPVSTSSLLLSSQLAFNLLLSVLLVHQRLTFPTVNCVVLLTVSSVLLGLGSSADRPAGVTRAQFFMGFLSILGASALFALYLPVMEILYRRVNSYRAAMEMQVVMEAFATLFALVGMAADAGFGELHRQSASVFDLGTVGYWATVTATVLCWQMCFMGTAGMVFLTTSLNSGICMTALMSMNVLGGVVVFGDGFGGVKAVSTALCVWAFSSYLYGEYHKQKEAACAQCAQGKATVVNGHTGPTVDSIL